MVDSLNEENNALRLKNAENSWKINELNSSILSKEDKIKFMTENVVSLETKISGLNAEILKLNSELQQIKSETISKQQEVNSKQSEITILKVI